MFLPTSTPSRPFARAVASALFALGQLPFGALPASAAPEAPGEGAPGEVPTTSTPAEAARPAALVAPPATAPAGPLRLRLELPSSSSQAERDRLLAAVARELGRGVLDASASAPASEVPELKIRYLPGGELTLIYQSPGNAPLLRSIEAPATTDAMIDASALLAGNLVRDEASGLLPTETQAAAPATTPETPPTAAPEPLPETQFNISIFHPMALDGQSDKHRVRAELGLFFSRLGALDGGAVSPGVLYTAQDSKGGAFALLNLHDAGFRGVSAGYLGVLTRDNFEGIRLTGTLGFVGGDSNGFAASGAADVNLGSTRGGQFAGGLAMTGKSLIGASAASIASLAGEDVAGLQLAGGASFARGHVTGVQLGGLGSGASSLNGVQAGGGLTLSRSVRGAQLAAGINLSSEVVGAQIGTLNVAGKVRGIQVGVVNVAKEVEGASLGVISYVPYQQELVTWYGGTLPLNLGVRFKAGWIYTMPTIGYDPRRKETNMTPGFVLGTRIPFDYGLFADVDGQASTTLVRPFTKDVDTLDLRARAIVGKEFTSWFGAFVGVSVKRRILDVRVNNKTTPEFIAGLQFL